MHNVSYDLTIESYCNFYDKIRHVIIMDLDLVRPYLNVKCFHVNTQLIPTLVFVSTFNYHNPMIQQFLITRIEQLRI